MYTRPLYTYSTDIQHTLFSFFFFPSHYYLFSSFLCSRSPRSIQTLTAAWCSFYQCIKKLSYTHCSLPYPRARSVVKVRPTKLCSQIKEEPDTQLHERRTKDGDRYRLLATYTHFLFHQSLHWLLIYIPNSLQNGFIAFLCDGQTGKKHLNQLQKPQEQVPLVFIASFTSNIDKGCLDTVQI